ncbi:hypothetical protein [Caulobacter sp. UNC358MFTsu5.1]|uniref:hypothetical protein n=1 Tax=Caulobacter sp. UNC358MFTsu5.1 TaxID=1449049 RepID=UPI0012DC23F3|nr:hypothetical protein [Caulobacter sp. UNC358MFTsu5.1]
MSASSRTRIPLLAALAAPLALIGALLASCGPGGTTAEAPPAGEGAPVQFLTANGLNPQAGEASPLGRLLIGRGKDYTPIAEDPKALFDRLEASMADRRKTAWTIVEALLEPQKLTLEGKTYEVPLWHTWYEGMSVNPEVDQKIKLFIAQLAACKADAACKKTRAEIAHEVMEQAGTDKNMVRSLVSANLTQVLKQSEGFDRGAPEEELGRGFTLFSPSFVEHVLAQAQGIETCSNKIPWNQPPPSASQFSPCVDEFPRNAVMVKTSWDEIDGAAPKVSAHATDAAAITAVLKGGSWPKPTLEPVTTNGIYAVQTTDGKVYGLKSIHFSTKDTREWIWISLWWSPKPDEDFGQDRPAALAKFNGGVWSHYKMCVTTAFNETDPKPWGPYESGQPGLASAIKAAYDGATEQRNPAPYDKVTTWCSNPNLEHHTGNGRTNCIGCHQYSVTWNELKNRETYFNDTYTASMAAEYPQYGRALRRTNFPAEFAWSFGMEFQDQIKEAREDQGFNW